MNDFILASGIPNTISALDLENRFGDQVTVHSMNPMAHTALLRVADRAAARAAIYKFDGTILGGQVIRVTVASPATEVPPPGDDHKAQADGKADYSHALKTAAMVGGGAAALAFLGPVAIVVGVASALGVGVIRATAVGTASAMGHISNKEDDEDDNCNVQEQRAIRSVRGRI
ncbi:hypothetical protein BC828DRAFT_415455 [Blastocladiella britannica]|nr:hypothetical protein BC828DRAFT_415455 [Blastocladiella britannica]